MHLTHGGLQYFLLYTRKLNTGLLNCYGVVDGLMPAANSIGTAADFWGGNTLVDLCGAAQALIFTEMLRDIAVFPSVGFIASTVNMSSETLPAVRAP